MIGGQDFTDRDGVDIDWHTPDLFAQAQLKWVNLDYKATIVCKCAAILEHQSGLTVNQIAEIIQKKPKSISSILRKAVWSRHRDTGGTGGYFEREVIPGSNIDTFKYKWIRHNNENTSN